MQPVQAVPVKADDARDGYMAVPVTATPVNAYATQAQYAGQSQYAGQPQPVYQGMNQNYQYTQMPPATYTRTVVVTSNGGNMSMAGACPYCGSNAPAIASSRTISFGQVLWMIILLIVFWPLFFLPLLFPNCYKQRFVCAQCGSTRFESGDGC